MENSRGLLRFYRGSTLGRSTYEKKEMKLVYLIPALALIACGHMRVAAQDATDPMPAISMSLTTTPTPTPAFSISDAELKKISKDQILATVKHMRDLLNEAMATIEHQREQLLGTIDSLNLANNSTSTALNTITALTKQVQEVTKHDADETARANKLDKAVWWYRLHWWGAWIMLGLGVLACAVFAFLKLTGRLALAGSAIAAKIP